MPNAPHRDPQIPRRSGPATPIRLRCGRCRPLQKRVSLVLDRRRGRPHFALAPTCKKRPGESGQRCTNERNTIRFGNEECLALRQEHICWGETRMASSMPYLKVVNGCRRIKRTDLGGASSSGRSRQDHRSNHHGVEGGRGLEASVSDYRGCEHV